MDENPVARDAVADLPVALGAQCARTTVPRCDVNHVQDDLLFGCWLHAGVEEQEVHLEFLVVLVHCAKGDAVAAAWWFPLSTYGAAMDHKRH
eukprot:6491430-Amphidinium_carterae.3